MRVGWFDAPENQPYRKLGWNDVATNASTELARKAAAEGIVLLKNDGVLPLSLDSTTKIGLFGDWANATTQLLGNYGEYPNIHNLDIYTNISKAGVPRFLHSPLWAAQQLNITVNYAGGSPGSQGDPTTNSWLPVKPAIDSSDILIYIGGIDNGVEAEEHDRQSLAWSGPQLDVIGQLARTGKPTIVVTMGGGQIDSSPLVNNANVSALLWAGYPGQDGGSAIFDILTGKAAPAGRLPTTQYPAQYSHQVAMTNMALRPGKDNPGRTYKWYNGTATYEFGFGLHYTNFTANITSQLQQSYAISDLVSGCGNSSKTGLDQCAFASVEVAVTNTGNVSSDYVTLGYIAGNHGPAPRPKKTLVAYQRLFGISGGSSDTARLNLTLASLARVDEDGNKVLYPGDYSLLIDNQPLTSVNFTLIGDQAGAVLEKWPQPPANRTRRGVPGFEDYFIGGYGSDQQPVSK